MRRTRHRPLIVAPEISADDEETSVMNVDKFENKHFDIRTVLTKPTCSPQSFPPERLGTSGTDFVSRMVPDARQLCRSHVSSGAAFPIHGTLRTKRLQVMRWRKWDVKPYDGMVLRRHPSTCPQRGTMSPA